MFADEREEFLLVVGVFRYAGEIDGVEVALQVEVTRLVNNVCNAFLPAAASAWLHGAAGDALVADGGDMSIVNMVARIGSMRIHLDAAGE